MKVSEEEIRKVKEVKDGFRVEYLPSTLCGFGVSTPPMEVHVKGNRIIRILPCHLPEDLKIWEIKTDRGVFTRP
ncbi:MAG: hypothetical protein QW800_05975, partial [Candidatus Bathyarchaeia archaeon]